MSNKKFFSTEEVKKIGDDLKIDWNKVDLEEFKQGLHIELEHGLIDLETNVTDDDELTTGKIAWAHLNEFPDYYARLKKMEDEADAFWKNK